MAVSSGRIGCPLGSSGQLCPTPRHHTTRLVKTSYTQAQTIYLQIYNSGDANDGFTYQCAMSRVEVLQPSIVTSIMREVIALFQTSGEQRQFFLSELYGFRVCVLAGRLHRLPSTCPLEKTNVPTLVNQLTLVHG